MIAKLTGAPLPSHLALLKPESSWRPGNALGIRGWSGQTNRAGEGASRAGSATGLRLRAQGGPRTHKFASLIPEDFHLVIAFA